MIIAADAVDNIPLNFQLPDQLVFLLHLLMQLDINLFQLIQGTLQLALLLMLIIQQIGQLLVGFLDPPLVFQLLYLGLVNGLRDKKHMPQPAIAVPVTFNEATLHPFRAHALIRQPVRPEYRTNILMADNPGVLKPVFQLAQIHKNMQIFGKIR